MAAVFKCRKVMGAQRTRWYLGFMTRHLEPLADGTGMRVRMTDGRAIGITVHGDPKGKPLLWFPGAPSCRLWPVPDGEATHSAGVRLVVVERPGCGVSDFQPNRRLTDWPRDVGEVADALGLDSFAVAGSSAGGPYVAASAYALSDRVRLAMIVGGPAPLNMPSIRAGMTMRRRALFSVLGLAPYAVPLLRILGPSGIDRLMTGDVPECDRRVLDRISERYMLSKREAFRLGLGGFALDLALVSRPWGFSLQSIRVPVHIWHGELDISMPIAMARCLATAIPTSRTRFFPGCGHFLAYQAWPEILTLVTS